MAVAVKTSPDARSSGLQANPALFSLVGVGYLLICLVVVFKLIPGLWWEAWDGLGLARYQFFGGTLLAVTAVACGVLLLIAGNRMLGAEQPPGVRAGVFVGFVGFLTVLLLTRWVSLWLEHWTYDLRWFGNTATPSIITAVAGLALLVGWIQLFLRPWFQVYVRRLEDGGWFSTAPYKGNQGQKVRRATILGILLLAGAGVYTMISHGLLRRGPNDWGVNIPFTGKVAVGSFGDTREFIAALPAEQKSRVMIRWPGSPDSGFQEGQIVSLQSYREAVKKAAASDPDLKAALDKVTAEEPAAYLVELNREVIGQPLRKALREAVFTEATTARLENTFEQTPWEDIGEAVVAFSREADTEQRKKLSSVLLVPTAVLVLDRYAVRDLNDQASAQQNVKVRVRGDSDFKEGQIVSREKFDAEVARLEDLRKKGRDRELPQEMALQPVSGEVQYSSLTLLPAVQMTLPLLIIAASLWLAWRLVNMPTFADFLIATEAELNKVSWTTQKRLVQDTVVVLVTVFLMSVFLFGMDWAWKEILSWRPIGVLHIPQDQSQQNQKTEAKRW
ncbi:MAG: preprotein translocase subunit SecE [Gemmataceae bacterium]